MPDPRPPVRYAVDVSNLSVIDPILAHLCGWASYYAYYEDAATYYTQILGATALLRIPADEATGRPQGYMMTLDECHLVVFAGTTDYSQLYGLLRDTFFGIVPTSSVNIAVGSVWAQHVRDILAVFEASLFARMSTKKVIFTGHSLGGAIAATLCWALQNPGAEGLLPSTAYSFGTPRVGDKNFSAAAGSFFNIINAADIVAKLPPFGYMRPYAGSDPLVRAVWPTRGFTNHGKVTYLDSDGGLKVLEPGASLAPQNIGVEWDAARVFGEAFFSGVKFKNPATLTAKAFNDSLEDHEMREYLRRLEKNIPQVADSDGESLIKEAVFVEDKLPPPPLTTIPAIVPPAYPTPAATTGVRPLVLRKRH